MRRRGRRRDAEGRGVFEAFCGGAAGAADGGAGLRGGAATNAGRGRGPCGQRRLCTPADAAALSGTVSAAVSAAVPAAADFPVWGHDPDPDTARVRSANRMAGWDNLDNHGCTFGHPS
jgi:hypothetical protein